MALSRAGLASQCGVWGQLCHFCRELFFRADSPKKGVVAVAFFIWVYVSISILICFLHLLSVCVCGTKQADNMLWRKVFQVSHRNLCVTNQVREGRVPVPGTNNQVIAISCVSKLTWGTRWVRAVSGISCFHSFVQRKCYVWRLWCGWVSVIFIRSVS